MRRDVAAGFALVDHQAAGRLAQDLARLIRTDRILEFDVHGFRMTDEHGHPHASRRELDLRIENLLRLGDHLPLFLGRSVIHEDVDLGNKVEGDALGELLRLDRIRHEHGASLLEQFVHRFLACARHRLIGRHHHALDRRLVVQGLQRHDELGGRAVRVGDDILLRESLRGLGIDLRHHQRHVGIHAESGRIVDDDAALRANARRPFLRNGAARGHQADIDGAEIEMLERLALERLVAERDLDADRAGRGQRYDFRYGEAALGEDGEHFTADIAGGADHRDLKA